MGRRVGEFSHNGKLVIMEQDKDGAVRYYNISGKEFEPIETSISEEVENFCRGLEDIIMALEEVQEVNNLRYRTLYGAVQALVQSKRARIREMEDTIQEKLGDISLIQLDLDGFGPQPIVDVAVDLSAAGKALMFDQREAAQPERGE